jgi:hypothetical protein
MRPLLALVLLLSGCRVFFRDTQAPQCRVNSDCIASEICFFKQCVPHDRDVVGGLFVEMKPPASLLSPPQQSELLASAGRATVTWTQRTRWGGTIRDVVEGVSPGGILTLTRPPTIPGRPIAFATNLRPETNFGIDLEPGSYDVTFVRTGSSRPAVRFGTWTIGTINNFDVFIAYPTTFTTISGRLLTTPSDLIFPGFEGATVYAKLDGQTLSSTVAQTGADGSFEIVVFGTTGTFTLFVGPGNLNKTLPELEIRSDATGNPLTLTRPSTALGNVFIGNVGSPQAVRGTVLSEEGNAVRGVSLSLEANLLGGVYRATAVSDDTGSFEVKLLRGDSETPPTYTVSATAPAGVEDGHTVLNYTLGEFGSETPIAITLPKRVLFAGRIVDAQQVPIPRMNILARSDSVNVSASTDIDGNFSMYLDPGDQTITATPPSGARVTRVTKRVTVTPDATEPLLFELERVALVAGEVVTVGTTRFQSAVLDFYRVSESEVELVGQASVDEKNHFSVALPAQ